MTTFFFSPPPTRGKKLVFKFYEKVVIAKIFSSYLKKWFSNAIIK